MSVIGLPPTGGFFSKWYLVLGTLEAGQTTMLIVLLVSSLLNAAYFLPIVYMRFSVRPNARYLKMKSRRRPSGVWCRRS